MANIVEIVLKLTDQASDKMSAASSKWKTIGANMTQTGKALTMGVTAPLVAMGTMAVMAASDLEQAMGAVETVFGDAGDAIIEFGKTAATEVGLSAGQFDQLAVVTGAFLQNVGYNAAEAADETINLTTRAADMAAVFNTDVTTALNAIQSGLKGEFNPLEQFGVKMNAAAIEAKALSMGLADSSGKLDDNAKAAAALELIYEQTAKTQGTFAEESGGVAGSMQVLKAQMADVAAEMGTHLLPIVSQLIGFISGLVEKFGNLSPTAQKVILVVAGIAAAAGPVLIIVGQLIAAFGAVSGAISTVAAFFSATLIPAITAAIPVIASVIVPLLPIIAVVAAIGAAIFLLYKAWTENWGGIQEKTAAAWESIKTGWENFKAFMSASWQAFIDFIQSIFAVFKPAFEGDWYAFGENLRTVWDGAWENIKGIFTSAWDALVNIATNIVEGIKAAFNIDWGAVGRGIIDGIIGALKSGLSSVVNAAVDVARAALKAIKGFLGIDSPSKIFMEIGKNINMGLAAGLQTSTSVPVAAMTSTAGEMTRPYQQFGDVNVNLRGNMGNRMDIAETAFAVAEYLKEQL